ncbi:MAG: hypothetical protein JOY99_04105 [Sphingomonadaceae bacterium]|nr:hypothetical protein [Sphingomonadaceae bacterium]
MFADLNLLLNETVQHWAVERDLFGNPMEVSGSTQHAARIVYTPGVAIGGASQLDVVQPAATIWLFDHPRTVNIGDTFKLPCGDILKAERVERRAFNGSALTKVYLK